MYVSLTLGGEHVGPTVQWNEWPRPRDGGSLAARDVTLQKAHTSLYDVSATGRGIRSFERSDGGNTGRPVHVGGSRALAVTSSRAVRILLGYPRPRLASASKGCARGSGARERVTKPGLHVLPHRSVGPTRCRASAVYHGRGVFNGGGDGHKRRSVSGCSRSVASRRCPRWFGAGFANPFERPQERMAGAFPSPFTSSSSSTRLLLPALLGLFFPTLEPGPAAYFC